MLEIIGFIVLLVLAGTLLVAGGVMMLASVMLSYNRGDYVASLVILVTGVLTSGYAYHVCPFVVGMR